MVVWRRSGARPPRCRLESANGRSLLLLAEAIRITNDGESSVISCPLLSSELHPVVVKRQVSKERRLMAAHAICLLDEPETNFRLWRKCGFVTSQSPV